MTPQSIIFSGFASGESDFAARYAAYAPDSPERQALDSAVSSVAAIISAGAAGKSFAAVTFIGYSDRNDTPGLSCDDRRASESKASVDRAVSANSWFTNAVAALIDPPIDNWTDSDRFSWNITATGAALLQKDPPADEAERATNRRVSFEVNVFLGADEPPA